MIQSPARVAYLIARYSIGMQHYKFPGNKTLLNMIYVVA